MLGVAAQEELELQLAELERQRAEGLISEMAFTVQRNHIITRWEQAARRHQAALRIAPPLPPLSETVSGRNRGRARSRAAVRPAVPAPRLPVDPAERRRRLRPGAAAMFAGALAVAVAAGAFLFLRGSPAPSGAKADTPATSVPALLPPSATGSTGAAPSSFPSGITVVAVDDTQPISHGGTVTLFLYSDHFSTLGVSTTPLPAGGFYAAVQLRVCAGSAALTVSPSSYVLVEPNHSRITVASGAGDGMQPVLALSDVEAGQCASGWLTYAVTARPASVIDTADKLTWTIPSS